MVPENILWAAYSASDYQNKIAAAQLTGTPEPKDVYYQNTKAEWVKVTAVFDCIDKLRRTYNHGDVVYLGAVLANTKGEIERGLRYPPVPEDKKTSEQQRKDVIKERLKKSNPNYGKMLIKFKEGKLPMPSVTKDLSSFWITMDEYSDDVWSP